MLEVFLQRRVEKQTGVECASREGGGGGWGWGGRQLLCLVLKSTCNYTPQNHNHDIFLKENCREQSKKPTSTTIRLAEALM